MMVAVRNRGRVISPSDRTCRRYLQLLQSQAKRLERFHGHRRCRLRPANLLLATTMTLSLPLISQYSFWTQTAILGTLTLVSYLHRRTRVALGTLISGFVGWKVIVPLFKIIIYILKGVGWFGFYLFFIQYALTSAWNGFSWLLEDGLPWMFNEAEKVRAAAEAESAAPAYPTSRVEEVD